MEDPIPKSWCKADPLWAIVDELKKLVKALRKKNKPGRFVYKVGPAIAKEVISMPLELSITNEQKVNVTITPVTDTGKPAKLDGAPVWNVVSGNATTDVAPDGLSAFLISSDDPGDTTFLIEADADLGEGVETLQDTILLHTLGATAKNLGLTAAAPVPK